jgi:dipeptidyl aminopeptidase/acylaminoacyl peptidase
MPRSRALAALLSPLLAAWLPAAAAQDTTVIDAFIKPSSYEQVKLSPDGQLIALVVPQGEHSLLATFRRADLKPVGQFAMEPKSRITGLWWVDNTRLVLNYARQDGLLARPQSTGELIGVNADGTRSLFLTGERGGGDEEGKTFAMRRNTATVWAEWIDTLPEFPRQALVATTLLRTQTNSTAVVRMDTESGRTFPQTRVPMAFANVDADRKGLARFASGLDDDGYQMLYYRDGDNADWRLLNHEKSTGQQAHFLGFNADDSIAYLDVQRPDGPDVVEAYAIADGARKVVLSDPRVDPDARLLAPDGHTLLAVGFSGPKLAYRFLDDASPAAKAMRGLVAAFPGQNVRVANYSADGTLALVEVGDDRDGGATYLFDLANKKAQMLVARQEWLDPAGMAPVKAFEVPARDGLSIPVLLTLPRGVQGKPPLVVMPHGGPIGVSDTWDFDGRVQLLAAHGFAVLQVNYRGSSGYGRSFELKGHRQWGGAIMDDIVDATRAVIAKGEVDGARVCAFGASFGAYASLLAPVRAPGLFRCAVGYVGVYDLPQVLKEDNESHLERSVLAQILGTDPASLRDQSPVTHAAAIKVPVLLAVGGQDETAPKVHSERMRDALVAAGNTPEYLQYDDEGHGYYRLEHQREFYKRLIAFLNKHLGVAPAAAAAPAAGR